MRIGRIALFSKSQQRPTGAPVGIDIAMKMIIATGGTGGHLFPAVRTAAELKRQGHEIMFLGSFVRGRTHMEKSGFDFQDLGARGFTSVAWHAKIVSAAVMAVAVWQAWRALRRFHPDAVLGFGGYGAFPVVLAAAVLRYPTLIHEQNAIPGRANALLAKVVTKVAVSFAKSAAYFNPRKTVLTGCPCCLPQANVDRSAVFKEFCLSENKKTVLVLGGSQGSRRINEVFLQAANVLKGKIDFQVIHVSGRQDYEELQKQYNLLGIPFALFEFLDKMESAYHISDLVVARAGAVTVSEIVNFNLPAVLVPYPLAGGHQRQNALILCQADAAQMIEEKDLSATALEGAILNSFNRLSTNPPGNQKTNLEEICIPDAAKRLAREAIGLIR